MEFLLLATGARRANLASELCSAAKIATVGDAVEFVLEHPSA